MQGGVRKAVIDLCGKIPSENAALCHRIRLLAVKLRLAFQPCRPHGRRHILWKLHHKLFRRHTDIQQQLPDRLPKHRPDINPVVGKSRQHFYAAKHLRLLYPESPLVRIPIQKSDHLALPANPAVNLFLGLSRSVNQRFYDSFPLPPKSSCSPPAAQAIIRSIPSAKDTFGFQPMARNACSGSP